MKKLVSLVVSFLFIAALLSFSFVAVAQEPAATPSPAGTVKKEPAAPVPDQPGILYKQILVIKGGNLALIAEKCGHRQTDWPILYAVNPQLPKVENLRDMQRVWIHPDQLLNLPRGWNYGNMSLEYVIPAPAPEEAHAPEETTTPMPPEELRIGATDSNWLLWLLDTAVWALILIILAAIAVIAVLVAITVSLLIRRRDPSRYPAMIPGGLSADLETAVCQLGVAYPGRRYTRIERCRLVRDNGVSRILVRGMVFGDGISRDAYLNPGDEIYRGTLPGGGCDYFLRSCGNLGPEFALPFGWRVAILQSQDVARPSAPSASATAAPTSAPAPTPEPEPSVAAAEAEETAESKPEADIATETSVTEDGLKEVAITITDEKGAVLSVAVKGHERALPTKLEKQNGKLVVFFHRDTTA